MGVLGEHQLTYKENKGKFEIWVEIREGVLSLVDHHYYYQPSWFPSVSTARDELPRGDLDDVVRSEHLGKTAVVRDQGCKDTNVSSSFLHIDLLHQKACALLFSEGDQSHKG